MSANKITAIIVGALVCVGGVFIGAIVYHKGGGGLKPRGVVQMPVPKTAEAKPANEPTKAQRKKRGQAQPFWERPFDYWVGLAREFNIKRLNSEHGEFYIADGEPEKPYLKVVYENGVLDEVWISNVSGPFDAAQAITDIVGAERCFDLWNRVDPTMAAKFRRLRHTGNCRSTPWIPGTQYAYGWSVLNNGYYVVRVGPPGRHRELIKARREIIEYLICLADALEHSRQKFEAIGQDEGWAMACPKIADEMASMALSFDLMRVTEYSDASVWCEHIENIIPDRWPECATTKLLVAGGRCKEICRMAERELRRGDLTFKPYDAMLVALAEESEAATCFLGRYTNVPEHKRLAELPEELVDKYLSLMLYPAVAEPRP